MENVKELAKQVLALSPEKRAEFDALVAPKQFGGTNDPDNDGDTDLIPDDPTHGI